MVASRVVVVVVTASVVLLGGCSGDDTTAADAGVVSEAGVSEPDAAGGSIGLIGFPQRDAGTDAVRGADAGTDAATDAAAEDDAGAEPAVCGDGVVEGGEECEGIDLGGADCTAFGLVDGQLGCTAGCVYDTASCLTCGNGAIDGSEDCDGVNLNGADCTAFGLVDGPLVCATDCLSYDKSACRFGFTATAFAGAFSSPLDAVPNGDASVLYFTASGSNGAGVFSVPADGGGETEILTGFPFVAPFGIAISTDDQLLFVADPGAGSNLDGEIFASSAGGGSPAPLAGATGTRARGLDLVQEQGADVIYFSGIDPNDGAPGLFRIPAVGGSLVRVATGSPFQDPSGVAVAANGDVYVVDTIGGDDEAAVILKVSGGLAEVFASGARIGYPGGIALTGDESAVLVSGLISADAPTAALFAIDILTMQVTLHAGGVEGNLDPAGLHRARASAVAAWVDTTAGGQGTVYRVQLE